MISGSKRKLLTMEAVLDKISAYDIYRRFCPERFELNETFNSPMPGRGDRHPSFVIGTKYGQVAHIDFGAVEYRGDCFDFVQQLNGLANVYEALKLIDKEFGLGLSDAPIKDYKKEITYAQPKIIKRPHLIQVIPRKFTREELSYWNEYYQDIDDLRRENIFSIGKLFYNKKPFHIPETELRFAYLLDNKWKIYRPFAEKDKKWLPNNINIDMMEGLDDIRNCEKALIVKSRKDRMVCRKVYPYTCSVQNESIICFSPENVKFIKENSKIQYLGYDSDAPGKKASREVTKLFGFSHINVPDKYLFEGIKDFAGLGRSHGLETIERHFKDKGLL